jgi:hypothetical protein
MGDHVSLEIKNAPGMPSRGRKGRQIDPERVQLVEDAATDGVAKSVTGPAEEVAEFQRDLESLRRRKREVMEVRMSLTTRTDGTATLTFSAEWRKGHAPSGNKNVRSSGNARSKS